MLVSSYHRLLYLQHRYSMVALTTCQFERLRSLIAQIRTRHQRADPFLIHSLND